MAFIASVHALVALGAMGPLLAAPAKETKPLTDAEIERNIKERFSKSKIASNNFRVKVTAGVATIEGKTDVVQHKGVATRLARAGGARAVNNRIEVSEAAKTKAAANLAEGRRRAQTHRGQPRSEPRTSEPPAAPRTTAPRSSSPRSALPTQPPQAPVPPAELRGARPPARQSDSSAVAPPDSGAAGELTVAPRRAVIRWEK